MDQVGLVRERYANYLQNICNGICLIAAQFIASSLMRQEKNIDFQDVQQLTALARALNLRFGASSEEGTRVILDNEDISSEIRSEQCGQDASQIAAIQEVRQALLERQRNFAQAPGLVTDGRDMGTVVFPKAMLKVFLYANEEERANRRYLQLKEKGINVSLAHVVEELAKRDVRDTGRSHAPLKPAEDAVQIDTTSLSIVQVFNIVLKLINERLELINEHLHNA